MSDVFSEGGEVISSSQRIYPENRIGKNTSLLLGIILRVNPSDDKDNMTARSDQQWRGTRHECTVLAGVDVYSPDILLYNVIIPSPTHSGMDNYSEDLPRGCSKLIDETQFNADFSDVDYGKLDGEWCVIGFLNGNVNYPFIIAWWPHPSNIYDPATTGNAYLQKSLVQADTSKNRFRSFKRVNGTTTLINREGSVYLDTTQANRKVAVKDGKQVITQFQKGGHVQVDIKKSSQFELNWNEKSESGPRLGAGSLTSSPVTDSDLPHPDQPVIGSPKARSSSRTFIRGKEYELLFKTSNISIWCEKQENEKGEFSVIASDKILLTHQQGGGKLTRIQVVEGGITLQCSDGTFASVNNDQVSLITASGGQVSVNGGQISISGPDGVTMSVPVIMGLGTDGAIKGTTFQITNAAFFVALTSFLSAFTSYLSGIKGIVDPLNSLTPAMVTAIGALVTAANAHNSASINWISQQVKLV